MSRILSLRLIHAIHALTSIKMTDKKGTSFRFTTSSGSNIFAFEKLANQKSHAPFGPDQFLTVN